MTWIKICGNTNAEDALAAVEAGADAVGFVFAPSPRRITPEAARAVVAELPATAEKVGVFVNESQERIRAIVDMAGLTAVQLHGDESPEFARTLFRGPGAGPLRPRLRVLKALAVGPGVEGSLRSFVEVPGLDGVLLDSAGGGNKPRGGTGERFDWERATVWLPGVAQRVHVILAGGLSPDNVTHAVQVVQPWGVDVCSGVECSPGKKEHGRMRAFVAAVRAARQKLVI